MLPCKGRRLEFGVGREKGVAQLGKFLASSATLERSQTVFTPFLLPQGLEVGRGPGKQRYCSPIPPFLLAVRKCLEQNQDSFYTSLAMELCFSALAE